MQVQLQPLTTTVASPPTRESQTEAVDFQSFLQLLTAQLRNQDPLSPLESTQFVAQLASFSTVEQLVAANARLEEFGALLGSGEINDFAGWIGRTAEVQGLPALYQGTPISIGVAAEPGAASSEVVVRNAAGAEADRLAVGANGGVTIWQAANATPGAFYSFDAVHHFEDGTSVTRSPSTFSLVNTVRKATDGVVIELDNGFTVDASSIISLGR